MRLRTLGGLWIDSPTPVPSLGPRRMALLALVAAAASRGTSRDRVIGLLWGETGEEQARHTLSQHLYSLRRDTGLEWIAATPAGLRLDPGVSSDIGEFQEALAAGDLEGLGIQTIYTIEAIALDTTRRATGFAAE